MKNNIGILLTAFLTSGCASTDIIRLSSNTYPEKPENCAVEILTQAPQKKYEELCMVNSRGGQSLFEGKSVQDLLPEMKRTACQCGADAIILTHAKEGGFNFVGPADRAEASATAIKFTQ